MKNDKNEISQMELDSFVKFMENSEQFGKTINEGLSQLTNIIAAANYLNNKACQRTPPDCFIVPEFQEYFSFCKNTLEEMGRVFRNMMSVYTQIVDESFEDRETSLGLPPLEINSKKQELVS